jgi:hypothetical protein
MAASVTQADDFGESLLSRRLHQRTDFPPMTPENNGRTTGTQHFVHRHEGHPLVGCDPLVGSAMEPNTRGELPTWGQVGLQWLSSRLLKGKAAAGCKQSEVPRHHRIGGMTGNDDFCEHAAGSEFEDALLAGTVHNACQSTQCVCDSENTTASRSAVLIPAADASEDGTGRIGPVRFRSTCNS